MEISSFYRKLPMDPATDNIVPGAYNGGILVAAPKSYWEHLDTDVMWDMVNGCGPRGVGDFFVPDTIFGMSIKAACKVHDWMYTIYNNEAGFRLANQIFLDNMLRINRAQPRGLGFLRFLRFRSIIKYHAAVVRYGRLFYYDSHILLYDNEKLYGGGV